MRDPEQRKRIRKRFKRQENKTAKQVGGRVQPGSGNIRAKGLREDVSSEHVLVQNKTTEKKSFSIKKDEFQLTKERALEQNQMPIWQLDIQEERLAVIRWDDLVALLAEAGML